MVKVPEHLTGLLRAQVVVLDDSGRLDLSVDQAKPRFNMKSLCLLAWSYPVLALDLQSSA